MIAAKVGNVSVDIKGLEPLIQRLSDVAAPVLGRMEAYAAKICDDARERWPVGKAPKKVRSRDLIGWAVTLSSPDQLRLRVFNTAPYTKFIRARNLGGKQPWHELLRKPLEAGADDLAVDVERMLVDIGNGRSA